MNAPKFRPEGYWTDADVAELLKWVARGKVNADIARYLQRSTGSIRRKLASMNILCNLPPTHINRPKVVTDAPKRIAKDKPADPWAVKVRFEDVTQAESRQISANAPRSGRIYVEPTRSIYGNPMAMEF